MSIIDCPNCNCKILIEQINCKIFIHGYTKSTMKQVNPHSKINEIESLKNQNNLFGCGSKFIYDGNNITKIENNQFDKY